MSDVHRCWLCQVSGSDEEKSVGKREKYQLYVKVADVR